MSLRLLFLPITIAWHTVTAIGIAIFQASSVLLDVNFFRHFILLHKTTTPDVSNISQEINAELTLRQVRWAQSPAFVLYSLRGTVCLRIQR